MAGPKHPHNIPLIGLQGMYIFVSFKYTNILREKLKRVYTPEISTCTSYESQVETRH